VVATNAAYGVDRQAQSGRRIVVGGLQQRKCAIGKVRPVSQIHFVQGFDVSWRQVTGARFGELRPDDVVAQAGILGDRR
jgi:hypothetical protein